MAENWNVSAVISGVLARTSGGLLGADVPVRRAAAGTIPHGNTSGQAEVLAEDAVTVPASSNTAIDLEAFIMEAGLDVHSADTWDFDEVHAIIVSADPTNGDTVDIEPGATNPWTGLGGASFIHTLEAGEFVAKKCAVAVGSSAKTIKITNNDPAAAATVRVTVLGR